MKKVSNTSREAPGFSLAEVLAALMIGAMVLVAVLGIYSRAETGAAAITRKLDSTRLGSEVLQRIAEDVDRIGSSGPGAKITTENKYQNGFWTARLTLLRTINNSVNEKQTFEKIVWQGNVDTDANSLVLYRSHSGVVLEDKLLDKQKESWEKELFVPVCTGVTFFKVRAVHGRGLQDKWTSDSLPNGIMITVSFARPFKTVAGTWDVPDAEKTTRTIALSKNRKIKFMFTKKGDENK